MRRPTSIDLFAGCGGLTRGLEWAGFDCIAFNELNKDASDTFATNFPEAIRLEGDIKIALTDDVISDVLEPVIDEKGALTSCAVAHLAKVIPELGIEGLIRLTKKTFQRIICSMK